jgi:adenosylcobinamide-GDP ribazoletransferase
MLTEPIGHEPQVTDAPRVRRRVNVFVALAAAVQFLTIVPPFVRRPFRDEELAAGVGWYSLVGVGLGGVLLLVNHLLALVFPPLLVAALVVAAWIVLTGALHVDGFLDSCDGVFGGYTPDARLRIMRDERAGAYAVVGGILLILIKTVALAALPVHAEALVVAPTLGRAAIALALVAFPYARSEGLGRALKDHVRVSSALVAGAIALLAAVLLAGAPGAGAAALAVVATFALGVFVCRRIPGLTGDIYGALCELVEVITLLVLIAGARPS